MRSNVRVAGNHGFLRRPLVLGIALAVSAGVLLYAGHPGRQLQSRATSSPWLQDEFDASKDSHSLAQSALAKALLSFEPNRGQADNQVKYLARGAGYTVFLGQDEAVLSLQAGRAKRIDTANHSAASIAGARAAAFLHMKLVGASSRARIVPADELGSRSNYLIGNDPSRWRPNVPQYGRVRYREIYPGIDLVYYGNQGRLEYDFEVSPGADPRSIALEIDGAQLLQIDSNGTLVAQTAAGNAQLHAPEVYQRFGESKRLIPAKFSLTKDNQVRFKLGAYDPNRVLVIDPVLTYATYLGGSGDEGCFAITGTITGGCPAVAVDAQSNIYVAGTTTSADFPAAGSRFQGPSTAPDVFVAKFAPNANSVYSLVYSTYLGGNQADTTAGLAVDSSSKIYVAGNTASTDFPTTSSGNQTTSAGGNHGFVTVLNAAGSALAYSTYVEGNGTDTITGLAIDTRANAYITGTTTSTAGFPITAGALQTSSASPANAQFFVTKFNTNATGSSSLAYSTYFGSTLPSSGAIVQGGGIAVDGSGMVYFTGGTNFQSQQSAATGTFPILNAFQACLGGATNPSPCPANSTADAFVAKLDTTAASGAQLKYSTYLGGSQDDFGRAIAVDSAGNAYVAGTTSSSDFVTPAGTQPFQASNNGGGDAFVAKIAAAGNALNYFSYLGGSGAETAYAIAVDANRGIHIAGSTTSNTNFPEVPTGIASFAGGTSDAFVAVIQTTTPGQSGGYSQTVGGAGDEDGTGVALDANANTYVAGETTSMNFPVASGQFTSRNGASDAFVAKIAPSIGGLTVTPTTSASSIGIGNQVTFTYTIKNTGTDVVNNLLFTDNLPASGATFVSAASTPGSCTAVVNGTVTCSLGSLAANAQAVVKIVLTPTVARPFNNSGTLQSNGVALVATSPTVTVNDFTLGVSPTSTTLTAGDTATYQVTLGIPAGQSGAFSNQVSLSCSAGVPTAAACTFSTNPLTMSNASPVSSTLTITTTARPVTTTSLPTLHRWYVSFLPITGLTLLGISIGGVRRRRFAVVAFAVVLFGLCGLQLACNNGSGTTQPKTGTPAGTYTITLTGTSGSASHAKQLKLVVQ